MVSDGEERCIKKGDEKMNIKTAIATLTRLNAKTMSDISRELGKNESYVRNAFSKQETISINTAVELLESVNCELVARDKGSGMEFVITRSANGDDWDKMRRRKNAD